ncbi:MAG: hypothetical protein U0797_28800 [Gemmataceae bacterium]
MERGWVGRGLFALGCALAGLIVAAVALAPLYDDEEGSNRAVAVLARDGALRRTCLASAAGLVVSACVLPAGAAGHHRGDAAAAAGRSGGWRGRSDNFSSPPALRGRGGHRLQNADCRMQNRRGRGRLCCFPFCNLQSAICILQSGGAMFDWLFEGRLTVYLALAVAALILLGLWVRDRKRGWLFGVAALTLLAVAYFLLDRAVETGREQIARKLHEMAAAVRARNTDGIFRHISDTFRLQGQNKAGFRGFVEGALRGGGVTELEVWNVQVTDDNGAVSLLAKPKGRLPGTDAYYLVRARFVKESDGQWRLDSFQVFNPFADTTTPLEIPQLGR